MATADYKYAQLQAGQSIPVNSVGSLAGAALGGITTATSTTDASTLWVNTTDGTDLTYNYPYHHQAYGNSIAVDTSMFEQLQQEAKKKVKKVLKFFRVNTLVDKYANDYKEDPLDELRLKVSRWLYPEGAPC